MRIYRVRHGESQGNVNQKVPNETAVPAIPLSTQGHDQAYAAGQWLANEFSNRFDDKLPSIRLWISPYRRTHETDDGNEKIIAGAGGSWLTDRREHILLCEQQFGLFDRYSGQQSR